MFRTHASLVAFLVSAVLFYNLSALNAQTTDSWTLTTADFQSQRIILQGITVRGVMVSVGGAETREIPYDKLLMLQRTDRLDSAPVGFVATLNSNDRISGQPRGIEGENLMWDAPALGRLSLPLPSVLSITREAADAHRPAGVQKSPPIEDIITLLNGDSVRGIIMGIDANAVTIQSGGEKTTAPLESLSFISFASPAQPTPRGISRTAAFRISLADSTAVNVTTLELRPDKTLAFSLAVDPQSPRVVPIASVVSIEQINGPVTWLSSLAPAESEQTSFFDITWPARMDHAVDGSAIRFADRTFARGIGVHSRSRLVYTLDPAWQTFRTQYAIAGDWVYANVDVRILLDGKVVHEKTAFRAGIMASPVLIDLTTHRQLIMEVDYGQNYDVQDRFNWIEPAFLKFKPIVNSSLEPERK